MFRHRLLLLFLVALLALGVNARSQDEPTAEAGKTNVQVLMRAKLTHMQKVLDGLVTNNSDFIAEEGEMLRMIGHAASWQAMKTKEYKTHSSRYASLTSNMTQAAKQGNHDAALLQYLQLNISCIECHQYIREQQHRN